MSDTFAWPSWMPNPLVDGYGIKPGDRRLKTDMEVSGVYRVECNTDEAECACSLILDPDEAAWFEAFERDLLRQGSTWFDIPLWVGGQLQKHRVRFKDRPRAGGLTGVHTTYTMVFDVSKRKLLCPCTLEFLLEYSPADFRGATANLHTALHTLAPGCTIIPPDLLPAFA